MVMLSASMAVTVPSMVGPPAPTKPGPPGRTVRPGTPGSKLPPDRAAVAR